MAKLVILKGPETGKEFTLPSFATLLGRQADCTICLESQAVSRHHAQILFENKRFLIEDLNSSNGTFLNGKRILDRMPLTDKDTLQVGPYLFGLRLDPPPPMLPEDSMVIREQVNAQLTDQSLYGQDPAHKLQVVL